MPAVQERFPEGVVQFAEAAAQMDPEEFEALMLAAMANADELPAENANRGGMPGQMPGFADWEVEPVPEEGDVEDVEESDEDEEVVAVSLSYTIFVSELSFCRSHCLSVFCATLSAGFGVEMQLPTIRLRMKRRMAGIL
jgi:hypothetical protein